MMYPARYVGSDGCDGVSTLNIEESINPGCVKARRARKGEGKTAKTRVREREGNEEREYDRSTLFLFKLFDSSHMGELVFGDTAGGGLDSSAVHLQSHLH